MKMSNLFYASQKEIKEAKEAKSYQFLVKGGFIRKINSGEYAFLPLGYQVIKNMEAIVRKELEKQGIGEITLPTLLPQEKIEEQEFSGKDNSKKAYSLVGDSLKTYTDLVKAEITSYKKLPAKLYHIQTKYRDEEKVRYGLVRAKEFIAQEGYCFDTNVEKANVSYEQIKQIYQTILTKCHIPYEEIENQTKTKMEYMFLCPNSDNQVIGCEKCNYQSTLEEAEGIYTPELKEEKAKIEKIHTPNIGTVEDLEKRYGIASEKIVKTILYKADGEPIIAMVKGDRDVSETKLKELLGITTLELADEKTVYEVTGAVLGFAGPIGLKKEVSIYLDEEVMQMSNFLVGANKSDYHYIHVNTEDFKYSQIANIRMAKEKDLCPCCKEGRLIVKKGMKLASVKRIQSQYMDPNKVTYIDENGKETNMEITEYKMGITRLMAAIAEANQDEKGIVWPKEIAPFEVAIIPIAIDNEVQSKLAFDIYHELVGKGKKVILDDRKERPGTKFNDAEQMGIPYRITVGRDAEEGLVEFCQRQTGEVTKGKAEEISKNII